MEWSKSLSLASYIGFNGKLGKGEIEIVCPRGREIEDSDQTIFTISLNVYRVFARVAHLFVDEVTTLCQILRNETELTVSGNNRTYEHDK